MRIVIIAILSVSFLSGCAAPFIAVAAAEVLTEEIRPELTQNGSFIYKGGDWTNSEERTTYTIRGKDTWKCADSKAGLYVCVSSDDMAEINPRSRTRFLCQFGKGGMFTQVFAKKSGASYFCERE
jgi:hypothetical protein